MRPGGGFGGDGLYPARDGSGLGESQLPEPDAEGRISRAPLGSSTGHFKFTSSLTFVTYAFGHPLAPWNFDQKWHVAHALRSNIRVPWMTLHWSCATKTMILSAEFGVFVFRNAKSNSCNTAAANYIQLSGGTKLATDCDGARRPGHRNDSHVWILLHLCSCRAPHSKTSFCTQQFKLKERSLAFC